MPPKPGRKPETWDDDNWLMPLPVPDAREGGESTWALWHEAALQLDASFAPTQPSGAMPLNPAATPPETPSLGQAWTVDTVTRLARRRNRVCPRPSAWSALYALLEGERYIDLQPPPLEPWIWTKLSALQKRMRLRDHIEWADRHGRLADVARFLDQLPEDDWIYMG